MDRVARCEILDIFPEEIRPDDLRRVAELLRRGGVIAYPTETVYGLGANVFVEKAVRRVFAIKGREASKAISMMIATVDEVRTYAAEIPEAAEHLIRRYWPGPLTLVLPASSKVPQYMRSPAGTVGLRLPDHPVTAALMQAHPEPVTSTSANLSGAPPATEPTQVLRTLGERLDVLIDAGRSPGGVPSTVVELRGGKLNIMREGAIPAKAILDVTP